MSANPENKDSTEVIVIGGEVLPETTKLKARHFDLLESVLNQLYHHQYRHVGSASFSTLFAWGGAAVLLELFELRYVRSLSPSHCLEETILFLLVGLMVVGTLCVFSKCFTRLAHARMNTLRVCQFTVGLSLFDDLAPLTLGFSSFFPGYEGCLLLGRYAIISFLSYRVLTALMTFKTLRIATVVYVLGGLVLFPSILFLEEARHFVFKDNEVAVYSDFGASSSEKLDAIDRLVDEAAAGLE